MALGEGPHLEIRYKVEHVCELIEEVEASSGIRFVVLQKQKNYGDKEWLPRPKCRVYWEHPTLDPDMNIPIPFDGQPFMFVGRKVLGCHQGIDKNREKKLKYQEQKKINADSGFFVQERKPRTSKKVNCPAQIYSLQIAKFPDYGISANTAKDRRMVSKQLKEDLKNGVEVMYSIIFITRIPKLSDHKGHIVAGQSAEEVLPAPPRRPSKRRSDAKKLIQKCAEITQTITEATGNVKDEPYLHELLATLESLQSNVLAHTSGNSPSPHNSPAAKRLKLPDFPTSSEVTIEISTHDDDFGLFDIMEKAS